MNQWLDLMLIAAGQRGRVGYATRYEPMGLGSISEKHGLSSRPSCRDRYIGTVTISKQSETAVEDCR